MARSVEVAKAFVTLETHTKGLEQGLSSAEKAMGRTAKFALDHPVAAAGAIGLAFAAASLKIIQMAADLDTGIRKIGTNLPEAVSRMDDLKETAKDLSVQFGIAQTDIVAAMQAIAAGGVESTDDLIARTRAVAKVVTATGSETTTVVGLLDATLDSFKLSGEDSEKILAKLLATAKGKISLEELAEIMATIGPLARESGVSFETLTAAAVKLADRNIKGKKAIGDLTDLLHTKGKAGLEAYAASALVASDGMAELDKQVNISLDTTQKQAAILKAQFNAALIDLATKILPAVTTAMSGFATIVAHLTGEIFKFNREVRQGTARATIESLTGAIGKLNNEASKRDALDRLRGSLKDLAGDPSLAAFGATASRVGKEDLLLLQQGYQAAADSGLLNERQSHAVARALKIVSTALAEKFLAEQKNVEQVNLHVDAQSKLTDAERQAVLQSKTLLEGQKQLILSSTDLTGAQLEQVARAVKEMEKSTEASGKAAIAAADKTAAAMQKITDTLAKSTVTLVDDTLLAIEKLKEELGDAKDAEAIAEALRPLNDQLKLIKVNEKFELPKILEKTARALTSLDVDRLRDAELELRELYKTTLKGTVEHQQVGEQLAAVQTKIRDRTRETADIALKGEVSTELKKALAAAKQMEPALFKIPAPVKTANQELAETVRQIASAAQGAIGVAQAFGLVDSAAAAVLQNVIAIGSNLPKALTGDLTSLIGVIGGLAGVISSLFGDSPETSARKELLKRNTLALQGLTEVEIDRLRSELPGAAFVGLQDALKAFFARPEFSGSGFGGQRTEKDLLADLTKAGVSIKDLEETARFLGLELRNAKSGRIDRDALRKVLEALGSIDFTEIGSSFSAQLDHLEDLIDIGLVKPTEKFGKILEILAKQGSAAPGITGALAGVDVGTTEGRAAAAAILQGLIENFNDLTAADLGKLTQGQFVDVVKQLLSLLLSEQGITGPETPGPQVQPQPGAEAPTGDESDPVSVEPIPDRFTPDLEASNWADLLGVQHDARDILQSILDHLPPPATGAPPPLPAGLFAGSPTGTTPGSSNVTVQVTVAPGAIVVQSTGDPAKDGTAAGQAFLAQFTEQVNQILGRRVDTGNIQAGNVRRT